MDWTFLNRLVFLLKKAARMISGYISIASRCAHPPLPRSVTHDNVSRQDWIQTAPTITGADPDISLISAACSGIVTGKEVRTSV